MTRYTRLIAIDLGMIGKHNVAVDINQAGQVVGYGQMADGSLRPFAWTRSTGLYELTRFNATEGVALRVNERGEIFGWYRRVGQDYSDMRGIFWTAENVPVDMGSPGKTPMCPASMNNDGVVVGWATTAVGAHAFRWTRSDGMKDLDSLSGYYGASYALSINDAGLIVGSSRGSDFPYDRAFTWIAPGPMAPLLPELSEGRESKALFVNNRGQIAGHHGPCDALWVYSYTPSGGRVDILSSHTNPEPSVGLGEGGHVLIDEQYGTLMRRLRVWTAEGGTVDVGGLRLEQYVQVTQAGNTMLSSSTGPSIIYHGFLRAVNVHGQVVGRSLVDDGEYHAFSWTASGGIVDLNALAGGASSAALAVNDAGQIVGYSVQADGTTHAMLWVPQLIVVDRIAELRVRLRAMAPRPAILASLDTRLLAALEAATAEKNVVVHDVLGAFIREAEAQGGVVLTVGQAKELVTSAQQIRASIQR
ncbi:hypothetical protein [Anaeromyxobacter oryzae]|uniref:Extracellular repeat protein, HAF family n=1 Tax=Anaeromyxobacter oryzae TaxID=2918170 RepID=A0ABM7WSH8_9BACT|nr:hypothetical protein [Anaeromyxobacter oryzae]BDG02428.1 hypothetical protein AMOR_14240 [Anaeromyxobacter oryzae]